VLTCEPALTAVLAGKLSVEQALADGMIVIDGNERRCGKKNLLGKDMVLHVRSLGNIAHIRRISL
jgi:hypothetical protein